MAGVDALFHVTHNANHSNLTSTALAILVDSNPQGGEGYGRSHGLTVMQHSRSLRDQGGKTATHREKRNSVTATRRKINCVRLI
jgi:hypothetical protein